MADAKKKATKKKATTKKAAKRTSKKKAAPDPRGLSAAEVLGQQPDVAAVVAAVEAAGGSVIGSYAEPLGGNACVFAALPIESVEPTPFQRDLSAAHEKRLTGVIDKLDRFLDPVIAVVSGDKFQTPNGNHRLHAMRNLGARSIIALICADADVAYKILALNTEKAHNLKEKSIEVIRMARELAKLGQEPESAYALEFEEPSLLTLGLCYEERARFSGSAYNSVLKRVESFREEPLSASLEVRAGWATTMLEIDDAVAAAVKGLKARGFDSPYLKAFVVARVNPIKFKKGEMPSVDEALSSMLEKAQAFDPGSVNESAVAGARGAPEE